MFKNPPGGKKGLNLPVEIEIKTSLDSTNKRDPPMKVGGIEVMGSLVSKLAETDGLKMVETYRKMTIRCDFFGKVQCKMSRNGPR